MKEIRYYRYDESTNTTFVYGDPFPDQAQFVSQLNNTTVGEARKMYKVFGFRKVWLSKEKLGA